MKIADRAGHTQSIPYKSPLTIVSKATLYWVFIIFNNTAIVIES